MVVVLAVVSVHDTLLYTSRAGTLSAHAWPSGELLWRDPDAEVAGFTPYAGELLLDGGPQEILATGQNYPFTLAVSDQYVVWASWADGSITKVAK